MPAELELPAIPAFVLTLVSLFTPYLIALFNQPNWTPNTKRLMSVAGSVVVSAVSLAIYYAVSQEPVPGIPMLFLLGLLVSQSSYALLAKPSAKAVEVASSRGDDRADPQ